MSNYVLYCRAGFERDCAAEIQERASEHQLFGFCRTKDDLGYVEFEVEEPDNGMLFQVLKLEQLIFTRQWFRVLFKLYEIPEHDRVSPIIESLEEQQFSEVFLDYPDTNKGKQVAGFCKKFNLPFTKALKQKQLINFKSNRNLHLFVFSSQEIWVGVSLVSNASHLPMGIRRLKFPSVAPSRSTLKLEEAFHEFIPRAEWPTRLSSGLQAVDLGAAPGGWTWQLVQKGMMVTAIDNGPMDEKLMDSGQVKHYKEDGFKYSPKKTNVYWLVCDMVEKPSKVGQLMSKWLENGWCREAIFNLKLPMKQRFVNTQEVLNSIEAQLYAANLRYELRAKQLYHDREEITVHVRVF